MNLKNLLLILLLSICSLATKAQESILKDFAEERRDLKLCFYPSTLRMLNISQNQEYNELIGGVEKLLIYKLDSATVAKNYHFGWTKEYQKKGYEEFVSMRGSMDLAIYGKEDEFVGVTETDNGAIAFYLRGVIAFHKIPKLVETFEGGDVLNLLTDQFK